MLELLFGKWLRTSRLSKGWKSQPVIPVSSNTRFSGLFMYLFERKNPLEDMYFAPIWIKVKLFTMPN